jgi:1-acyl-sn-glycerol-3-phosphate acyltransferase
MDGLARFAGFLLRLLGWQVVGQLPSPKKFIVLVAPHTSNWDFFVGLALGLHWKAMRKTIWFGKHTIFVSVIGRLLKKLGGIPIDRSHPQRVVTQTIDAIKKRDELILALAPEGTRKWTDHWKSGFYLIALKTGLPVALAFIDYKNKRVGVGPLLQFIGQPEADWELLRQFYQKEWARYPADFSEIRPKRH